MQVSEVFYQRDFRSKKPKDAYIMACEWVAKVILSKNSTVEVSKVSWRISRLPDEDLPTFRLTLMLTFDEDEINEGMCKVCKEMHASFFINENYNCNRCNKEAYRRKIHNKLEISCEWFKKQVSSMLDNFN